MKRLGTPAVNAWAKIVYFVGFHHSVGWKFAFTPVQMGENGIYTISYGIYSWGGWRELCFRVPPLCFVGMEHENTFLHLLGWHTKTELIQIRKYIPRRNCVYSVFTYRNGCGNKILHQKVPLIPDLHPTPCWESVKYVIS